MPIPLELNQGVRVLVPFGAVSYPWDAQVVAVDLPRFEIVIPDLDLSEVALYEMMGMNFGRKAEVYKPEFKEVIGKIDRHL